jgi:hypothetical protein
MRRFGIGVLGLLVGAALGGLFGACDYFHCNMIQHPLTLGKYTGGSFEVPYSLVLGTDGRAIETYTDELGPVRVEYALAPAAPLP